MTGPADIQNDMMTALIGHASAIDYAEQSFNSGKMPHAWLISGPAGIGKSHFALQFAAAIIASDSEKDAAQDALFSEPEAFSLSLDVTRPAIRQVLQNAHPDFLYIAPEDGQKSGMISVEQIRSLIPFFAHKSATGGWRVAIIDNLDAVNLQGANAMLKIVEEPPEKAIIFLISSSIGRVLPTIRSRTHILKMAPLAIDNQISILKQHLPDAEEDTLRDLALFAGGSMGYALQVAQTDALDLYEATCRILSKPKADAHALLEVSGKWGGARSKELLPIASQAFCRLLSAAALVAAGQPLPDAILACEVTLIEQLAQTGDSYGLSKLHDETDNALRTAMRAYLDMPSVFMSCFDKIHSIAHP